MPYDQFNWNNQSQVFDPMADITENSGQANRRRQQQYVNRLGMGGGQFGGVVGPAGQSIGQINNAQGERTHSIYDTGGAHLFGTRLAPGQNTSGWNAGSRRLGDSSVNYGAVAGISNALQWSPNPGLQAALFRSQGIMPTSQGVPLDLAQDPQIMRGLGRAQQSDAFGFGQRTGFSGPVGGAGAEYLQNYLPGVARTRDQQALGQSFAPQGGPGSGGGFGGAGFGGSALPGGVGVPGFGTGGGSGGGAGVTGLPLERGVQGAIQGILNRPSPYTSEQQARLRSQATSGLGTARDEAVRRFREDAVRRGLNPAEIESSLQQINSRYDQQGQNALLSFETQQALLGQQGLLSGIGAGTGLMGQQIANEDSIRRYLAMLGSAQMGQAPLFLSL